MDVRTTLGIAALAFGLFGCAGGGGGGPPAQQPAASLPPPPAPPAPPPPPPPSPADAFRTVEYSFMGALDSVHAAEAYALGYDGLGVIVGFVDFNFDFASSEVNYHPASRGADAASKAIYEAQTGKPVSTDLHGHAVAAAAAARKNDLGIHGIAYNATVLAVDYFSGVEETQFVEDGDVVHVSDPWAYLTAHGARIVNMSYGYEEGDRISNPPAVDEYYVADSPALAVAYGALLVSSAGNAGLSKPSKSNYDIVDDLNFLGILDSGPGAFIVAGAVDGSNTIAFFSDRAGSLADRYMVAPGSHLLLPWNGLLGTLSGTSFSAPLISGAAAIVLQRWPGLTAREVAEVLFQSATDLGDPGVDSVYGHGLLDLDMALRPVGTSAVATADGSAPAVGITGMVLGTAFGDAARFRAALSQTTILDGAGRDFEADLSGAAHARPGLSDLFGALQQRLGWHSAGFGLWASTQFDFHLRDNAADGIVGAGISGGLEASLARHQSVVRLSGGSGEIGWTAGTGLSLRDALSAASANDPFSTLSLGQGFAAAVGAAPASFAGMRFGFGEAATISFGVAHAENQGIPSHYFPSLSRNTQQAAALRFDRRAGASRLGVEFGVLTEAGGVLGSLASGGLKMADRSATAWTSASYEASFAAHWAFKGSMTVSATAATAPHASLVTSLGPIYATSFALGVARDSVFGEGDAWSLALGQPLRAESAPVALGLGRGRDWSTGRTIMMAAKTSLAPSGRELDFESGYRFPLGDWTGGANIVYSIDSGHVRGADAVAGLFWLSRKF